MMGRESHYGAAPWDGSPELPSEICGDEPCHEHYLTLGLSFFHTLMKASHEDQMRILRENFGIAYSSLSSALEEDALDWDNPMYDAWKMGAFLGFDGNNDRDGANAAWVCSARNKVEVRYNQYSKEGLRKWGYIMWDKRRLDEWNVLLENPQDFSVE